MPITLNIDQYHLQTQLNISTSRMQKYADMSIDEIIDAEAENGNVKAKDYGRKLFGSIDELMNAFQLDKPTNKYNIINKMSAEQRNWVLDLLDDEDMVMGLNFFTQDKLLQMMSKVSIAEAASVALEAFPMQKVIQMIPEDDLERFFMSDDVRKEMVAAQLKNLDPEMLIQLAESITGQAADSSDGAKLISKITSLPDKQFKETVASLDPDIQRNIVFLMANEDKSVLLNFGNETYTNMLADMQKPDMVKSMIALNQDSLQIMTRELPEDLFSIVATQIDTKQFAKLLIDRCPDILDKITSYANASTIS